MIRVTGLTRRYGTFTAVNDVSFTCRPGRVTGFLGPNGAGKTTTMRALVGLTSPTSGTATIGGHRYVDLPNPDRHVGVLLDASAQHAGRTGREILALSASLMGLPTKRIDELLTQVALTSVEASRRVRHYSLGMRQRLGIAHALLGDPEVLILDEPANGLDPAGIRWMRALFAEYASRGGTVLLSSHLLHEVELIADELLLIGEGRIVARGDRRSVLDNGARATTVASSLDDDALRAAATDAGFEVTTTTDGLRIVAAVAVGAAANVLHGAIADTDPVWDLTASQVGWTIVMQVLWFLMAFGLGMLLLNTPAAVTVFYVFGLIVPLVIHPPLYALLDGADRLLPWLDLTLASLPLMTGTDITGQPVTIGITEWAQLSVATTLWVIAPFALGGWRILRAQVQ